MIFERTFGVIGARWLCSFEDYSLKVLYFILSKHDKILQKVFLVSFWFVIPNLDTIRDCVALKFTGCSSTKADWGDLFSNDLQVLMMLIGVGWQSIFLRHLQLSKFDQFASRLFQFRKCPKNSRKIVILVEEPKKSFTFPMNTKSKTHFSNFEQSRKVSVSFWVSFWDIA